MQRAIPAVLALGLLALPPAQRGQTSAPSGHVLVLSDRANATIEFGAVELRAALQHEGLVPDAPPADAAAPGGPSVAIVTTSTGMPGQPAVGGLRDQGFAIRRTGAGPAVRWWVIGHDPVGAMYGALDLAETIRIGRGFGAVDERDSNPAIARRGIKFNIPLDVRTPSYSDDSTSAQANIGEMWSMEFWTRFLDEMARHRYNFLSLWSLSPFPSLVKVPEYPDVALADVKKKAGPLWDATLQGRNMFDPRWPLEIVRRMTIDEKITFWRAVMQYAKDRGIDVSVFTWNIFVYGTEGSGYGITDSPDNAVTRDYVRRSVRALFATYPLLAAIGITTGENMGNLDNVGKERWAWETYGLGVSDAIADAHNPASPAYNPARVIRLIHRAHQADLNAIVARFKDLPGSSEPDSTLAFSFKYSQAHMLSSTAPRFIYQNGWFASIPPGKQTWLTVRNDDVYYLRWGDPDFAREYFSHLPDVSKIAGFYMGPDGYTWGREVVTRQPASARPLVIDKAWYSFLIWGRLAYDPTMPDRRFEQVLATRFPGIASERLFAAWAASSKILPLVTRFYWGSLDFMWYPEACWSNTGFTTVQDFIAPKYPPMSADEDGETPRIMGIKAFVDNEAPANRLTPLDVADRLERHAQAAVEGVRNLAAGSDEELGETVDDIRAMAWLGRYYAAKIRAGVELYRFETTHDAGAADRARIALDAASSHWREYARIWSAHYTGQVLTRMGLTPVDIQAIQTSVDRDGRDVLNRP
jgi:hypothetical protein